MKHRGRTVARPKAGKAGFTLIEVLLATVIFGAAVVGIVQARTTSLRGMLESERLAVAVQLAQSKMTEAQFKYQRLIDKDGMSSALGEENGTFDEPFAEYSWKVALKESKVEISQEQILNLLTGTLQMDKDEASAQVEQQKLVLTNLNKLFKENYAELRVDVEWKQFGRTMSLPVVTHLTPTKPKVELTTQTEDAGS
jgi:prepilin-type N-terminal cleavage/methylation domain-containing protein